MSLAYSATANATTWGTSVSTSSGISVSVGDLIVIGWGGMDSRYDPTTCSDSLGNTYTLRSVLDSTNDSTICIGWCISAYSGSATFTGNMVSTASQRCFITVITFTVDSGDTISVDDEGTLVSGWASSPFITSEFSVTGTDCVAVAFYSAMLSPTFSNQEIPDATAATVVTSGYTNATTFYQLITSTGSGLEAATNSSASAGVAADCVVFKSTASAGSEALASTVTIGSSPKAMITRILNPRTSVTSISTVGTTPLYRIRYYANAVTTAASTITGNFFRYSFKQAVVNAATIVAGSLTKLGSGIGSRLRIYMRIGRGRF